MILAVAVGGVACAADWGEQMDGCGSVQQCPPLMAPLASGAVHRTQQLVSCCSGDYQRAPCKAPIVCACAQAPTKSMALLLRVPCKAPINGCRAAARSASGAIARGRPSVAVVCPRCVAFNVSALRRVPRCGDAARQTMWRCAVSALPRSRVATLSMCGVALFQECNAARAPCSIISVV